MVSNNPPEETPWDSKTSQQFEKYVNKFGKGASNRKGVADGGLANGPESS
jgi:hypothetical protein